MMSVDVYRQNEKYCLDQARKPGADRQAWLVMAEQWAFLIRTHVNTPHHDQTPPQPAIKPRRGSDKRSR